MEGQSVNEIQVEQPYLKLRCRYRVLPAQSSFCPPQATAEMAFGIPGTPQMNFGASRLDYPRRLSDKEPACDTGVVGDVRLVPG